LIAQRKQLAPTGIDGLRWWVAGLIFLATLINFVNRLTISVLAPVITEQLKLTNLEFASITNSFLLA
jgi:MFS transporter, ACS family, hexuronate transporter